MKDSDDIKMQGATIKKTLVFILRNLHWNTSLRYFLFQINTVGE